MAKEKKITRVNTMTADAASMFFVLVMWATDNGTKDSITFRNELLDWMGKKGLMESVYETKRTPEQVVEDFKKRGFKIDDQRKKDK